VEAIETKEPGYREKITREVNIRVEAIEKKIPINKR
jgi:hypothetical protein